LPGLWSQRFLANKKCRLLFAQPRSLRSLDSPKLRFGGPVSSTLAAMPFHPPEYEQAVEALTPVLEDLPPIIVAIDGRDGSGKTTPGRFLAWHFNISLIETGLFLFDGKGLSYRVEEIKRVVGVRLSKPRPVIIEGIALLSLLPQFGGSADFLIYVKNKEYSGSHALSHDLRAYENTHTPEAAANLVPGLSH
jgi:hypothetical protein